jgi:hypothetical protein
MKAVVMYRRIKHRLTPVTPVDFYGFTRQTQVSAEQQAKVKSAGESQLSGSKRQIFILILFSTQSALQRARQAAEIEMPYVHFSRQWHFQFVQRNFAGDKVPRANDSRHFLAASVYRMAVRV